MTRHTMPLSPKHRALIETPAYQSRFWSYVDKSNDCWLWKGARFGNGYGAVRVAYLTTNAHRIAWEITNGPIGPDEWALHSCESAYPAGDKTYRLCVRPAHLYLGSPKDNGEDRALSGRTMIMLGMDHQTAILDESAALAIRVCYATGRFTQEELGQIFGVRRATVGSVVLGKHFRWVKVPDVINRALLHMATQRRPNKQTALWELLREKEQ